jgi:hypothetical protein
MTSTWRPRARSASIRVSSAASRTASSLAPPGHDRHGGHIDQHPTAPQPQAHAQPLGSLLHRALGQGLMSRGGQLLEPPGIKLPRLDLEQVAPSPGEQRRGPRASRTTVREQLAQAVKLAPGLSAQSGFVINTLFGSFL